MEGIPLGKKHHGSLCISSHNSSGNFGYMEELINGIGKEGIMTVSGSEEDFRRGNPVPLGSRVDPSYITVVHAISVIAISARSLVFLFSFFKSIPELLVSQLVVFLIPWIESAGSPHI